MKLLLDEMFTQEIAVQLQRRGHDVTSVQGQEPLMSLIDAALFAVAQTQQRVIVTENVADFLSLDASHRSQGRSHYGIILTTHRKFPRQGAGIGNLVRALEAWLSDHPGEAVAASQLWWL